MKRLLLSTAIICVLGLIPVQMQADPCGMVPPIYMDGANPITRIGLQKTYVFHKNGMETFVIKPGFEGKVDNFGMLIPFPNPPAIRKVADDVFSHVANAVDPPEVVMYANIRHRYSFGRDSAGFGNSENTRLSFSAELKRDQVKVLKQEAVGMYEVATLAAGSAESLKRWMDENGYKYPDGMDKVTEDYVKDKWCFVAVKTKVGDKSQANPQPGQRTAETQLPDGSVFDGHVQAMGFRFASDDLVVPMRLSAFNEGDLRNIVYVLSDSPKKIRHIPEEYVVRQVSGVKLMKNLVDPLPLRVIGGTVNELQQWQRDQLPKLREPSLKNGIAKLLFMDDLQAVATGQYSLDHEEQEKELLRISEHFGLRGPEIDRQNLAVAAKSKNEDDDKYFKHLRSMTLTVVDGDFPRNVLAEQNLAFDKFKMAKSRNNSSTYDAKVFGPGTKMDGRRYEGKVSFSSPPPSLDNRLNNVYGEYFVIKSARKSAAMAFGLIFVAALFSRRKRSC